jgi:hypothetical protein
VQAAIQPPEAQRAIWQSQHLTTEAQQDARPVNHIFPGLSSSHIFSCDFPASQCFSPHSKLLLQTLAQFPAVLAGWAGSKRKEATAMPVPCFQSSLFIAPPSVPPLNPVPPLKPHNPFTSLQLITPPLCPTLQPRSPFPPLQPRNPFPPLQPRNPFPPLQPCNPFPPLQPCNPFPPLPSPSA